jgi:hypothetical protein
VPRSQGAKPALSVYDQAKDTLPENLYPAYRLLDRIIAANPSVTQKAVLGLRSVDPANCRELIGDKAICALAADRPDVQLSDSFLIWAIQVSLATNGRPNAFATSYNNRIIINRALEQSFDGSFPAKACVIAHELAHIQKDHMKAMKESLQDWNNEAAVSSASGSPD